MKLKNKKLKIGPLYLSKTCWIAKIDKSKPFIFRKGHEAIMFHHGLVSQLEIIEANDKNYLRINTLSIPTKFLEVKTDTDRADLIKFLRDFQDLFLIKDEKGLLGKEQADIIKRSLVLRETQCYEIGTDDQVMEILNLLISTGVPPIDEMTNLTNGLIYDEKYNN